MYQFINYKKVSKLLFITFTFFTISNLSYSNIVEELTSLNNLYKEGAITKEEFSKAKSIILKSKNKESKKDVKDIELNKNNLSIKEDKEEVKKKVKEIELNKNNLSIKEDKEEVKKEVLEVKGVDLTKTYISLKELDQLGTYIKIDKYPDGLFKALGSPKHTAKDAMKKMYMTFVQKPKLLEKYPEDMMKAMAYFEVFYNYELKDKEKSIEKFKKNYPDINWKTKKDIKSLYSLNNAKKSMREAMSLNDENTLEEALNRYMFMHNFLKPAEKITHNLSKKEKKLKKENSKLKKNYGNLEKIFSEKSESRINNKDFEKKLNKNLKKIKKSFKTITNIDSKTDVLYSSINEIFVKSMDYYENCKPSCKKKELDLIIDTITLNLSILKEFEPQIIRKKYTQNMDVLNIDSLKENEQATLVLITSNLNKKKIIESDENQEALLNIQTNGFNIDDDLNTLDQNGFEVKSLYMSFDTLDNMKLWSMNDWANSWRGELPDELKDSSGNIIEFSDENIKDIEAQLAINYFNSILENGELRDAMGDNVNPYIQEISEKIKDSADFDVDAWLAQDFSISLDNYSKLVGNSLGIELGNFDDLTTTINTLHGTNISAEEYASNWETSKYMDGTSTWGDVTRGVDLINQLGSFDAASIAKDLGTDLETVADTIIAAANVGISSDLEAVAEGLGYSSFAEAVAAYNEQYGTNYTEESAKEALGQ